MQLTCRLLKTDDLGRNHLAAKAGDIAAIYEHNRVFWTTRNIAEISEEKKREIIDAQVADTTPYNRGATLKLQEIFAESSRRDEFSMLEIGAANGTVMQRIRERFPNPRLKYVGFECLPILVDDFRKKFPDQTMHVGAVEDFIGKQKSFFEMAPFTLFYAAGVFLMIKPDLVRKALHKAGELAEQFLIWDYVDNPDPEFRSDETLVLHMPQRWVLWFVHPWEDYLAEIGFKIIDKEVAKAKGKESQSPLYDHQLQGYGHIHAVRG